MIRAGSGSHREHRLFVYPAAFRSPLDRSTFVNLSLLLQMAADSIGDRTAWGPREGGVSFAELRRRADQIAGWLAERDTEHLALIAENSVAVPPLLFGAATAGVPFAPLNYRLTDVQLATQLDRLAPVVVVVDAASAPRVTARPDIEVITLAQIAVLHDSATVFASPPAMPSGDDVAVSLFTSGTTGEPKIALLRHRHLAAYVISTVEFAGGIDEVALVSVPPYHVAGVSGMLTGVYSGRRQVVLPSFDADTWLDLAVTERVTHAMVVPTMLQRLLDRIEAREVTLPDLRHLSYGGGRMPLPVIERALRLLPHVGFVNAYGLTETSSTIAVLTADDHRTAMASPASHARLGSVGRPLPAVEVSIRDPHGREVAIGDVGEVWVRGDQVAGEYAGRSALDEDGWFHTNDAGRLDTNGFLYVEGRLDDVIVRGAENVSPGEIEDTLVAHPEITEAAVFGLPDPEWGERIAAAVVLRPGATLDADAIRGYVRGQLRSSKTPDEVHVLDALPYNVMGKLLRGELRGSILAAAPEPSGRSDASRRR